MSIHDGHRQRLKKRFRNEGLTHFDDLYVLELLLFYCVPRQDTNPLAHRLLDRFGSLPQVLDARPEEMEKVEGVGENISTFLTLIREVDGYYQVKKNTNVQILPTIDQCGDYLLPHFRNRPNETVFMLCLDAKCKVLACKEVGEGSVNSANVPIRRVVEMALAANASTVILAHNHPSGLAIPSDDDIQTTLRLVRALEAVEIVLADHIVVANEDYVSMVQSGYLRPVQGMGLC